MPTLGESPAQGSVGEPHRARTVAESFGSDPERYDRSRPRYPEEMVERIVAMSPGADVLDVGIGTGIAARQFQATGCRVLGVDVDQRMADVARAADCEVEVAPFETWDPAGRTFDAVIAGQAWHWVDPVAGAAKAAAVLRPRGRLAVFWNVFQPPPVVAHAFARVYDRVLPDVPGNPSSKPSLDAYAPLFARASSGMGAVASLGTPEEWQFQWHREYSREEWLDQVPTFGGASHMQPDRMDELLAGVSDVLDGLGGGFTMGYTTVVVTAARTGAD